MDRFCYLDWAVHPRRWKSGDHPDVVGDRPDMRGPLSQLEVPPVSFRPRTDSQMDCVSDTIFYHTVQLIAVNIFLPSGGEFIPLLHSTLRQSDVGFGLRD